MECFKCHVHVLLDYVEKNGKCRFIVNKKKNKPVVFATLSLDWSRDTRSRSTVYFLECLTGQTCFPADTEPIPVISWIFFMQIIYSIVRQLDWIERHVAVLSRGDDDRCSNKESLTLVCVCERICVFMLCTSHDARLQLKPGNVSRWSKCRDWR